MQWIKYFLVGIEQTSQKAVETLSSIIQLKEKLEQLFQQTYGKRSRNAIILLHALFENPFITIEQATKICQVTYKSANDLVKLMQKDSILTEMTGQSRNRLFIFNSYMSLFN